MRIWEKKKTVELLEKLRILNYKSAYMYRIATQREDRLILRNFYYRLYTQKILFLDEIEEKIEQLKREISPIQDPKALAFYKRRKLELSQLYLKYKMRKRYADIHKRELKSFKKYKKYLSKVSHAQVRELLLAHRHKVKLTINEMNHTGVMKFPVA